MHFGIDLRAIDINEMFKATILLTLSLAIFDLVKAIFEEEVLGSIESLMLVFKFALTAPAKLQYAVYLIMGVSLLLISLSLYMKFSRIDTNNKKC